MSEWVRAAALTGGACAIGAPLLRPLGYRLGYFERGRGSQYVGMRRRPILAGLILILVVGLAASRHGSDGPTAVARAAVVLLLGALVSERPKAPQWAAPACVLAAVAAVTSASLRLDIGASSAVEVAAAAAVVAVTAFGFMALERGDGFVPAVGTLANLAILATALAAGDDGAALVAAATGAACLGCGLHSVPPARLALGRCASGFVGIASAAGAIALTDAEGIPPLPLFAVLLVPVAAAILPLAYWLRDRQVTPTRSLASIAVAEAAAAAGGTLAAVEVASSPAAATTSGAILVAALVAGGVARGRPLEARDRREREERRRRRRRVLGALGAMTVVAILLGTYGALRLARAAQLGRDGKEALLAAESALRSTDHATAAQAVRRAEEAFGAMDEQLAGLGPLRSLARVVPFVRVQMRAVDTIAGAGELLSASASDIVGTSKALLDPEDPDLSLGQGLVGLQDVHASLLRALRPLERANEQVAALDDDRLLGPLASARDELVDRLPEALETARETADGLDALLAFAGTDGPRRYLILSQNPDEVRPTGGFVGTYGVLVTDGEELELERYEPVERWRGYDVATIPNEAAPRALRLPATKEPQRLTNATAGTEWADAAAVAIRLWNQAGEVPVDGVIGITPETLAGLVGELGPVQMTEYGETVTGDNLIDRVDFYAHRAGLSDAERKQFVADLAEVVVERLLDAPATEWVDLGRAVAASLDLREAMVWAADERVMSVAEERGWDGSLPATDGDFFFPAEFEYANKNGRALRRTFDHHVELRADGSARITTKITTANTRPPEPTGKLNVDAVRYVVVYGPEGASLAPDISPVAMEEPIAGHPAFGFEATGPPLGSSSYTVAWEVPDLLVRRPDGTSAYELTWLRLPAHSGDVLNLKVSLPATWTWAGETPPRRVSLDRDFRGSWAIVLREPGHSP